MNNSQWHWAGLFTANSSVVYLILLLFRDKRLSAVLVSPDCSVWSTVQGLYLYSAAGLHLVEKSYSLILSPAKHVTSQ